MEMVVWLNSVLVSAAIEPSSTSVSSRSGRDRRPEHPVIARGDRYRVGCGARRDHIGVRRTRAREAAGCHQPERAYHSCHTAFIEACDRDRKPQLEPRYPHVCFRRPSSLFSCLRKPVHWSLNDNNTYIEYMRINLRGESAKTDTSRWIYQLPAIPQEQVERCTASHRIVYADPVWLAPGVGIVIQLRTTDGQPAHCQLQSCIQISLSVT